MKKILQDAIVQMVRIGNKVNWNEPIDNDYVNALNGLRALLEATQQSVHPTRRSVAQKVSSKSKKVAKPARG
jgi:hypothetical protein